MAIVKANSIGKLIEQIKTDPNLHSVNEAVSINFDLEGNIPANINRRIQILTEGKTVEEATALRNLMSNAPSLQSAAESLSSAWTAMGAEGVEFSYNTDKQQLEIVPIFNKQAVSAFAATARLENRNLGIGRGNSIGYQGLVPMAGKNGQAAYGIASVASLGSLTNGLQRPKGKLVNAIAGYQKAIQQNQTELAKMYQTRAKSIISAMTKAIRESVRQDASGTGEGFINGRTPENRRVGLGTVNYGPYLDSLFYNQERFTKLGKPHNLSARDLREAVYKAGYTGNASALPKELRNDPTIKQILSTFRQFHTAGMYANGTGDTAYGKEIATIARQTGFRVATGRKFAQVTNIRDLSLLSEIQRNLRASAPNGKSQRRGSTMYAPFITPTQAALGETGKEAKNILYSLLNVSDEQIKRAAKKIGWKGPVPSVEGGQLLLDSSLADEFNTSEAKKFHYTKEDIQKARTRQEEGVARGLAKVLEELQKKQVELSHTTDPEQKTELIKAINKLQKRQSKLQHIYDEVVPHQSEEDFLKYFFEQQAKKKKMTSA